MMKKSCASHSGIDNKSWLCFFPISPPTNSSTALLSSIWMLCMHVCCISNINWFPRSKEHSQVSKNYKMKKKKA